MKKHTLVGLLVTTAVALTVGGYVAYRERDRVKSHVTRLRKLITIPSWLTKLVKRTPTELPM